MEEICAQVSAEGEVCVAANYNCPGQIVISGSIEGINKACELMKAAGAKRALPLKVGGAFHSPLMNPAKVELEAAIKQPSSTLRSALYIRMWMPFLIPTLLKSRKILLHN